MRYDQKTAGLVALILVSVFSLTAVADETVIDPRLNDPMIEFNAGAGASAVFDSTAPGVNHPNAQILGAFLFRLKSSVTVYDQSNHSYGGDLYVAATLTGNGYGSATTPYTDIQFNLFQYGVGKQIDLPNGTKWEIRGGLNTVSGQYLSDTGLWVSNFASISLAGAWVDSRWQVHPDVQIFAKAVANIAGFAFSQHLEPGLNPLATEIGYSPSLTVSTGIKFWNKLRISFNGDATGLFGTTCHGSNEVGCPDTALAAHGVAMGGLFHTQIAVSYDVMKYLQIFASMDNNFYVMKQQNIADPSQGTHEAEGDTLFMLGISGVIDIP